jgi:hypothetical protein
MDPSWTSAMVSPPIIIKIKNKNKKSFIASSPVCFYILKVFLKKIKFFIFLFALN